MSDDLFPALFEAGREIFHTIPEDSRITLAGRHEECQIRLSHPGCSRKQFRLIRKENRIWVQNLSRTSPTRKNGAGLEKPSLLRHADCLQAGSITLIFLTHQDTPAMEQQGPSAAGPPPPEPVGQPIIEVRPEPEATIVGKGGGRVDLKGAEGEYELVPGTFLVGRNRDHSNLCLPHPQVSRVHAEIKQDPAGGHSITDLRSANGTFVNGGRISRRIKLQEGDQILIGPYTLEYTGKALSVRSSDDNLILALVDLTRQVISRETGKPIRILDQVSLVVQPRDFVCILGPSGSGKSTLMNGASGRIPATSGSVLLNGRDLYKNFDALKQSLAYVPQKEAIHLALTVQEALRYSARLRLSDAYPEEVEEGIQRVLQTLDLEERKNTRIRDLSGGQLRRMGLANEIISKPSLLFLDEVTSGLDELTDREVMRAIRSIADSGKTVVSITHNLANIPGNSNLIVLLTVGGKLAFFGSPEEALGYFSIPRLGDIYESLKQKSPQVWQDSYRDSRLYDQYIRKCLPAGESDPPGRQEEAVELRAKNRRLFWKQLRLLSSRYARLLTRDLRSLILLLGQPVLVGLLLAVVFGSLDRFQGLEKIQQTANVLFLLSISCIWFGCNNSAKEIVKERAIYIQERDVNLNVPGYYISKLIILGAVCLAQVFVILSILKVLSGLPGSTALQLCFAWAVAFSGTLLGLLISSLSPTPDVAVSTVPIVLIPQVIFAGLIIPLEGIGKVFAWLFVPNYWAYQALQKTLPDHLILGDPHSLVLSTAVLLVMSAALAGTTLFSLRRAGGKIQRR